MARFLARPVEIEARLWDGTGPSTQELVEWVGNGAYREWDHLMIPTLEGMMAASVGDWIVKGLRGEFYPCKPDVFERKYQPVT